MYRVKENPMSYAPLNNIPRPKLTCDKSRKK